MCWRKIRLLWKSAFLLLGKDFDGEKIRVLWKDMFTEKRVRVLEEFRFAVNLVVAPSQEPIARRFTLRFGLSTLTGRLVDTRYFHQRVREPY